MGSDQKRVLLAVVLSAAIIFGWQALFPTQKVEKTITTESVINKTAPVVTTTDSSVTLTPSQQESGDSLIGEIESKIVILKNNKATFALNNLFGVGQVNNNFSDRSLDEITGAPNPFTIQVLDGNKYKEVYFNLNQSSLNEASGTGINFPISFAATLTEEGKLNFNISSKTFYKFKFVFHSTPKELENKQIRNYVYLSDSLSTIASGQKEEEEKSLQWFGVDFDFHVFLMIPDTKKLYKINTTESKTQGEMELTLVEPLNAFSGSFIFMRKNYDKLTSMGNNLDLAVDFGMWSLIAVPILRGLQFFYSLIPNYGIAIILLTLVLRLLTFPLQYKSIKSMNKMKDLQPELKAIKEKYKDDQQRAQKETMELFKKSGYNPMGGCLPIILQIPIFFAFYKVLYNAVELVGAPFFGWISDLSVKDPYYVLPVLMGISFFLQQKFTPTPTVDKTQQKIMMFMPLIFVFIMKDLPSGLTLYIFVSTVCGIAQQVLMHNKKTA